MSFWVFAFWLSSTMMQWDGRYFLSFFSESEGKSEATVIQTRMLTSQQNKDFIKVGILTINVSKIANWNPIDFQNLWCISHYGQWSFRLMIQPLWKCSSSSLSVCWLLYILFCRWTCIHSCGTWMAGICQVKFCSRTRNHRRREEQLCSRTMRIQASKSSSRSLVRKIACTSSLTILFLRITLQLEAAVI